MPTPPIVTLNCGRTLSISAGVPGADPACDGTKTYTFTYTLCDNTTKTWVYTYTISAPTVTMPADGSSTCLLYTSDAADERSSVDLGGRRIIKKNAGVPGADPACTQKKTYTFCYTLGDKKTKTRVYTYTISAPTVTMPADGSS